MKRRQTAFPVSAALACLVWAACGDGPTEPPRFTLSGTVSDPRREGMVVPGVTVRLAGTGESTTTGADGKYRVSNVGGTQTVTVAASPSYVSQSAEITMDADRTLDFVLEHTGEPPFAGTPWITPDIITSSDLTSLGTVTYAGRGIRLVFDRRLGRWTNVNAYLFDALFGVQEVEFHLNPEFADTVASRMEVDRFGPAIGRLPAALLSNLRQVQINAGEGAFGGSSHTGGLLIHTEDDATDHMLRGGFLEEVLLHEAAHMSLDMLYADSADWQAAQAADGVYISDYARDFPQREDVAESILMYFAVRYVPDRVTAELRWLIVTTIPNRIAFFDGKRLDMSPFVVTSSSVPAPDFETMRPLPRTWRPFEAPLVRRR
ncbi:MAG: carboxypeptidase-like regulatory domain-containing protein [Gemmatimonadetes bacterium]|nr:carboxypeptidase-like regulatory domain-containing protein [Gemmatimonadota bacterium]MYD14383.1 carboxypeptidase-like regulatory domain-containing protein [Gemmatimonadota bacterium]MYI66251.1 carboxypeptidase-like regulatory domain-containing protein [Gemmatimonadota bacterium]